AAELAIVAELAAWLRRDEGWGLPAIPDLREALRRLRVDGSVLDPDELRDVAVLLTSSRSVRRSIVAQREQLVRLAAEAEHLTDLSTLISALDRAIDENGQVRDDASAELARLRRGMSGARARIVSR